MIGYDCNDVYTYVYFLQITFYTDVRIGGGGDRVLWHSTFFGTRHTAVSCSCLTFTYNQKYEYVAVQKLVHLLHQWNFTFEY